MLRGLLFGVVAGILVNSLAHASVVFVWRESAPFHGDPSVIEPASSGRIEISDAAFSAGSFSMAQTHAGTTPSDLISFRFSGPWGPGGYFPGPDREFGTPTSFVFQLGWSFEVSTDRNYLDGRFLVADGTLDFTFDLRSSPTGSTLIRDISGTSWPGGNVLTGDGRWVREVSAPSTISLLALTAGFIARRRMARSTA